MSVERRDPKPEIVDLGSENFGSVTTGEGIVLMDCWAAWCKACKDFAPVFDAAAARHPSHSFAKLDTQHQKDLVAALGIEQVPSLVLFRDGLMLFNQAGYFDAGGLDNIIAQAEALDMREVRAAIEAEQRAL